MSHDHFVLHYVAETPAPTPTERKVQR